MIPTKPSDVLSVWSTLSARGIVQEEPKDDQTNATLERSGDQTGDEEDEGTPRFIVTTANGRPMSRCNETQNLSKSCSFEKRSF